MISPPHAFHTARVILLSVGHAIHDMYPAFLAPLLPLLQAKLSLSNTLAGSLATFLRSSSLVQPFIGYLADRTSARLFVILAPGATAVFMSLVGAAPSQITTGKAGGLTDVNRSKRLANLPPPEGGVTDQTC